MRGCHRGGASREAEGRVLKRKSPFVTCPAWRTQGEESLMVESCLVLDINQLAVQGCLTPGWVGTRAGAGSQEDFEKISSILEF